MDRPPSHRAVVIARETGRLGFSWFFCCCCFSVLRSVYQELVEWNGDLGLEILGTVYMSIPGTKGTVDLRAVD